jgi:hypothetical protein
MLKMAHDLAGLACQKGLSKQRVFDKLIDALSPRVTLDEQRELIDFN